MRKNDTGALQLGQNHILDHITTFLRLTKLIINTDM